MDKDYGSYSKILKAIADPKRLKIVDMLSCGELCACKIQEEFQITQPTLSHDMKILCDAGIVLSRREGKWSYYSLCQQSLQQFYSILGQIFTETEDCICHDL